MSTTRADGANGRVMALLAAGVPLSLLLDLASSPDPAVMVVAERADLDWLRHRDGVPAPGSAA